MRKVRLCVLGFPVSDKPGDTAALCASLSGSAGRRKVMFPTQEGRVTNGLAKHSVHIGAERGWGSGSLLLPFPPLPLTPGGSRVTGAHYSLSFFNPRVCKWVPLSVGNSMSLGSKHRLCNLTAPSHLLTMGPQASQIFTEPQFPQLQMGKQLYPSHWVGPAIVTLKPL